MRIRKLSSGNYQALLPIGKDSAGKYRYKSFTASDEKTAEKLARDYKVKHPKYVERITVGACVDAFLTLHEAVLSPGTMRGYTSLAKMLKERYGRIWKAEAHDLTRNELQKMVNSMAAAGLTPKTIRNYIGLIGAALKQHDIPMPSVSVPRRSKPEYHIPTQEDVRKLAETAAGTEMEVPLALACIGLRRGEICALDIDDLTGNTFHIHRAVAYDADGILQWKDPKTPSSVRFVQIPPQTAETIRRQGYVTLLSPRQLSRRFVRLMQRAGVQPFRFHDLRHFFVSYCHTVLRLSDAQIQALGGWSTSHVMNEYYRQTMNQEQAAMLVANKIAYIIQ